jgi:putative flippase GtrA
MTSQTDDIAIRFVKFASVGAVATASHYLVLVVLVNLLQANAVLASSCGYVVGGILNYMLNYQLTFRSSESHMVAAPKFFTIATIGFFVNGVVMSFALNSIGLHYLLSQVIATLTVLVWNFFGNSYWTFKRD